MTTADYGVLILALACLAGWSRSSLRRRALESALRDISRSLRRGVACGRCIDYDPATAGCGASGRLIPIAQVTECPRGSWSVGPRIGAGASSP